MEIRIVEAQPDEFNLIQYIVEKTWPVAYGEILSREQLEYMIGWLYALEKLNADVENGHQYFLAKDEEDTAWGFIGIENRYKGEVASKLHKIYLLPEAQGKGIGRMLMEKAEELAKKAGSERLLLNVNRQNKARFFYENLGFEIVQSEDIDIGNGYLMEDYVMRKRL